jgi:hypothetical protein
MKDSKPEVNLLSSASEIQDSIDKATPLIPKVENGLPIGTSLHMKQMSNR